MVVQSYVEEGVYRRMVVVVDNQNSAHHSHCLDMHHRMVVDSPLEVVVAMRDDQILVLLPSLIIPTLMLVLIIVSISNNNIGIKLEAKGVRVHSSRKK
ncbi:hypothetical protein AHAS_Ahas07G0091700 [Arachis hypogaea]